MTSNWYLLYLKTHLLQTSELAHVKLGERAVSESPNPRRRALLLRTFQQEEQRHGPGQLSLGRRVPGGRGQPQAGPGPRGGGGRPPRLLLQSRRASLSPLASAEARKRADVATEPQVANGPTSATRKEVILQRVTTHYTHGTHCTRCTHAHTREGLICEAAARATSISWKLHSCTHTQTHRVRVHTHTHVSTRAGSPDLPHSQRGARPGSSSAAATGGFPRPGGRWNAGFLSFP